MTEKAHSDTEAFNSTLSKLSNLKITEDPIPCFDSKSTFYYALSLPIVEKMFEETKTTKAIKVPNQKVKEKAPRNRRRKSEVKMRKVQEELENLTITIKNEGKKKRNVDNDPAALLNKLNMLQTGKLSSYGMMKKTLRQKPKESKPDEIEMRNVDNDPGALLNKLNMLQTGKLPSYSMMKKTLRERPKESKSDEIEMNRQEVNMLNLKIRDKISREIKPKLRKIIGDNLNGIDKKTIPEPSQPAKQEKRASLATLQLPKPSRPVPIAKTSVSYAEGNAEIYRYSFDDLFQLQYFATWEIVPRLLELNICATPLSDHDKLVMKLISLKSDGEILKAVLDEAEKRQFVTQSHGRSITFSRVMKSEPQKRDESSQDFGRINATAKSDDELNEAVFHHDFVQLFGGSLQQPLSDSVQSLIDSNQAYLIEGEVRVNGKNSQEAYITHPQGKKDICVQKLALRRYAFNGDFVKVLVKQENEILRVENGVETIRSYGCVLEIIEKRHSRRVVGSITGSGDVKKRNLSFKPRDTRIPTIRIGKSGIPNNIEMSEKSLLVVEITGFVNDQGKGNIVDVIGIKGDLKSENMAILLEHNLDPQPFTSDIEEQFSADFVIPESEFAYREDLRKKCIFSIDPESARDLDDALSCEELANGNIEIGVHISDVSFFLKENSDLDRIVKEKATTIYLVDQVYHMLPVSLCMRCSLLPGSDKIAYSVFWEMNKESGEILSTRFARSIVNSCGKLSYDHAQNIIEGKSCEFPEIFNGFTIEDVSAVILKLQKIALILRQKRKESGALKIDQPKIAFKFNDDKFTAPTDFFKYEIKDSNRLIEEFMLLANISVAEFIYKKFPSISLLRCHPPPNEGGLKKLIKTLEKQGFAIDASSSSSISESMEKLILENRGMNGVLNLMVSKTMNRARYFCSEMAKEENEFWHYALAIPMYTHFTSPIRRYADVLVHRVLNAALDYEPAPSRTSDEVHQLANVCNVQKYAAKLAGDDSCELYFKSFIKSLKSKAMMAGVVGVFEFNLELVLLETGHVIKVYYKNLQQTDDVIIKAFSEDSPPYVTAILPKSNRKHFKIVFGSSVLVQVEVLKDKLVINRIFYNDL